MSVVRVENNLTNAKNGKEVNELEKKPVNNLLSG
jgi:hypothetical protein